MYIYILANNKNIFKKIKNKQNMTSLRILKMFY